jgi:hypothetical protein
VFGAAHASYPQQPAYARIAEITPAFLVFGLIYLRFGLVPVIIAHFLTDVVWISLPIFLTHVPGIGWYRALVVVFAATPVWVVLARRAIAGRWTMLTDEDRNSGWKGPATTAPALPLSSPSSFTGFGSGTVAAWGVVGSLALIGWILAVEFKADITSLRINRSEAKAIAGRVLAEAGMPAPKGWTELAQVRAAPGQADRFIWQEEGKAAYADLHGKSYLYSPYWYVRFVRFDESVDVAERAEEFYVTLCGTGDVLSISHRLPEARPGPDISEADGRWRAVEFLRTYGGTDVSTMKEISVKPEKHPQRTDWHFTYADTNAYPSTNGEARVTVGLSGETYLGRGRGFHVPESWERMDNGRQASHGIVSSVCSMGVQLLFIGGLIFSIVQASRKRLDGRLFVWSAVFMAVMSALGVANRWPAMVAGFSTAEPFKLQVIQMLAGPMIGIFLILPAVGMMLAVRNRDNVVGQALNKWVWVPAVCAGMVAVLILGLSELPRTKFMPTWPDYGGSDAAIPWLGVVPGALLGYLMHLAFLLLTFRISAAISNGWTRLRIPAALWLLTAGFMFAGRGEVVSMTSWLLAGGALGGLFVAFDLLLFRRLPDLLMWSLGVFTVAELGREATLAAYPGAVFANILAAFCVAALTWLCWRWKLARDRRMPPAVPMAASE